MFGHHDDQQKKDEDQVNTEEQAQVTATDNTNEITPDTAPSTDAEEQPAVSGDTEWQHPGTPVKDDPKPTISDVVSPAGGFPRSTDTQVSSHPNVGRDEDLADTADNDLIDIRQNALTELAPLVDELDQEPEEKFRTLMMVIQASDDQKLIKQAYEAAHGIKDEKVRAQALLDIVNEINYFTQPEA